MKKLSILILIFILALCISGCAKMKYPDLPQDALAFDMGEYIDEADDDAAYGTIEYNGRTYMPYGTIKRSLRTNDIDSCIGYIVQDGEADTDERIYTLTEDSEHNFLMQYYGKGIMEQPTFWRATDTQGKDISIPDYIESLDYGYWR